MLHNPKTKRPSFLSGVGILTLSSLTVKVMGLFYRIPLLGRLGTEGMGYFIPFAIPPGIGSPASIAFIALYAVGVGSVKNDHESWS